MKPKVSARYYIQEFAGSPQQTLRDEMVLSAMVVEGNKIIQTEIDYHTKLTDKEDNIWI